MKSKFINSLRNFFEIKSPVTCKSNITVFLNETAGVKNIIFLLYICLKCTMYMSTPNKGRLTTYRSFKLSKINNQIADV